MSLTVEDLRVLLRNYARLEQAAARMFLNWAAEESDPALRSTLEEFAEIEKTQAHALVMHLKEVGGELGNEPVPIESAINEYLVQIDRLPTLAQRLRFNYTVMSTLERPVVMQALLSSNPRTLELFHGILNNEDRILSWCDQTSAELGCASLDPRTIEDSGSVSAQALS